MLSQIQSALEVPLLHPELFQRHRRHNDNDNNNTAAYAYSYLKPLRGVLLHGPSGAGKSAMATQVAQQWMASGKFVVEHIHCTTLQSQAAFEGQAEQQLVQIFLKAQRRSVSVRAGTKQGCLLILDDIHLICQRRQGIDRGADRLTSTLSAMLDGIGGTDDDISSNNNDPNDNNPNHYPSFILCITTNRGMLDPAVRRPN